VPEAGQPRTRLRALRTERGWTQQDVADRLITLAWMRKPRKNVGCSADMVAKWEAGRKGISPLYRELLAKLYGVTIAQLGIDAESESAPATDGTDRSLVSFLDTAASLLDQLGAGSAILAPQMFALWKDEIANRRAMFTLLDPLGQNEPKTPEAIDLKAADQLADTYEHLYGTAEPAALLTPVAAHVQMVGNALCNDLPAGDRQGLLRNRARVAMLAGQLAFRRLRNLMAARAFFSVAFDDIQDLGDDRMLATVLGLMAEVALADDRPRSAARTFATAKMIAPSGSPVSSP
jgi:transcriptional regulator with XRE-family HTH domain